MSQMVGRALKRETEHSKEAGTDTETEYREYGENRVRHLLIESRDRYWTGMRTRKRVRAAPG